MKWGEFILEVVSNSLIEMNSLKNNINGNIYIHDYQCK